ncbi:TPA: pirin family protein [Burkholderia cenocepacia]|uniref:pirin family protein n=1 Tax=unclassified Burkholderia TaxID=2613784 RepID=UPI00158C74CE|nr:MULTISPECIES: pirin family protein [unclassified Burkholderia]HEF5875342.1 pirin family protein [Burkholderia cenocepacia]
MLQHKPLAEIARVDLDWLKARHHFAFGAHGNQAHRPVGPLFLFNDDEIVSGSGWPLHPHANVEIITYVQMGAVTHEDSLGNKGRTQAGDVQVMSAGTGIRHSEYNEEAGRTRMFQIWLRPRAEGGEPRWGTRAFPMADRAGRFVPLASGYGAPEALPIRSDAEVYGAWVPAGATATFVFLPGHSGYLAPARGSVRVNDQTVEAGEGLVIQEETAIEIDALADSELVLVTMARD